MEGQNLISVRLTGQTNVCEYLITEQEAISKYNYMEEVLNFLISKGKIHKANQIIQT